MGPFFIVGYEPLPGDGADMLQVLKEVSIENFISIGFVEPFDKGVLRWLAGLNVMQPDSVFLTPAAQMFRDKFGAIVYSDLKVNDVHGGRQQSFLALPAPRLFFAQVLDGIILNGEIGILHRP